MPSVPPQLDSPGGTVSDDEETMSSIYSTPVFHFADLSYISAASIRAAGDADIDRPQPLFLTCVDLD